jgi:RHS repeat-associated protein
MNDPWFNENLYSWIPGTALGVLGGLWGGLAGTLAPRDIDARTYYDALGRTTKTIADYTDGIVTAETNATIEYTYDGANHVTTVQADEPAGAYQRTQYVYGVTTATGSGVNSNDILAAVQHPDVTTGNPSASQQDSYLVNALGQVIQKTDRNGNVHQYAYDVLVRLSSDAVTTLGAGVDGAIRRIQYAYDTQGNQYLITSYDAAVGGNIVNQVQRVYNGLGQLTGEYQSHSGAVVVGTTPEVQYAYTEMAGGVNNSRLTSMTYPSGYVVNYNYAAGLDGSISRLTSLSDASGVLESYKYLGLGTVVERDHPQNNVNLTYISQTGGTGDAGDQYTGLDRFGRVIDQNWYNTATSTSTDDFQYGYDRNNNALYRQNALDAIFSELFTYDALNQLTSFQRGTLNATHNGLVGNPTHAQSWTPDALGNFTGVTTDGTTQTRTANQQNEITSISGAGAVTSDANGNTTADGSGNTFVYDAWNRLVAVKIGGTTLAAYGYNGLGERVTETHGTTTTDLYYSAAWQVLEERIGGVVQARNVWSPVYVDALVLRDQSSLHNGVLDQRLYVQTDANWNVTALVDASGNVLERYVYDPYGAVTVLAADWSSRASSAYSWMYFFQGKRRDGAVGLDDSRDRVYSPTLMRPLQADPLGLAPGVNYYRWEGDDPTGHTDPSGTDFITLGDRSVFWNLGLFNHYSIEYWITDTNPKLTTEEMKTKKLKTRYRAVRRDSFELLNATGYSAQCKRPITGQWRVMTVDVSVISQNTSRSEWDKVVFVDDDPAVVKAMWDRITIEANAYRYAEHRKPGYLTGDRSNPDDLIEAAYFDNWPQSRYQDVLLDPFLQPNKANNSNTFARWILHQVDIKFKELGGEHPGACEQLKSWWNFCTQNVKRTLA